MNPQELGEELKAMMLHRKVQTSKILGCLLKTSVHDVYVHRKVTCE